MPPLTSPSSPSPRPSLELSPKAKRLWIVLAAVAGVIVLTGGGYLAVVGTGDGEPDAAADASSESPAAPEQPADGVTLSPSPKAEPTDETKQPEPTEEPEQSGVLVVEVTSTGSDSGLITYVEPTGEASQIQSVPDASLPWREEWTGVESLPLGWNAHIQQAGGGELSCTVTLDGEVVASGTSSGQSAAVICSQ